MRRFVPPVPTRSPIERLLFGVAIAFVLALSTLQAQIPGRNVNMVSGVRLPDGDPFLQRQNEPSIAASTRNPLHLLGGSNDYRTVDLPNPDDGDQETGDAWLGLYKSADGGQRWISTLLPGYPQDQSLEGMASPLKAYSAGADPVVRAGTNGLFYYAGLAFDRGKNGKSAIFMARFIDNNNREERDATAYLGTTLVAGASGVDGRFLDKPWMAVDIPRGGKPPTCRIETPGDRNVSSSGSVTQEPPIVQTIPAGTVYVAYSSFSGPADDRQSEILLTRSFDCGVTWQAPMRVSRAEDPINQGATISIDPRNGHVYVAWRRFFKTGMTLSTDAIMLAKLPSGGRKFNPPGVARRFPKGEKKGLQPERFAREGDEVQELNEFDQGTSDFKFRTNAYPVMTVDGEGRVYLAWSERGFATFRSSAVDGDARIVMVTTTDGSTFTAPAAIDNAPGDSGSSDLVGHQVMPSLAFAGGKLMVAYYDLRETKALIFERGISDENLTVRNTIDIRAAMATPGEVPQFAPSVKVSEYLVGFHSSLGNARQQLQFNPPNLPMFKQGTVPFMGDYIDLAAAPNFVRAANGKWMFNTEATAALPVFHAVWTDNRDVRAPADGKWTNYGPPDSALTSQPCVPGNAGSRNQNIYTSRLTGGLLAGSPGNTKPLSATLQRGFVVFAHNTTTLQRAFRMTIVSQPAGGRASFDQFPQPPYTAESPAPRTSIDLRVPPRSAAARTVYVTSTDPHAQIAVDISEIAAVGGSEVPGGLEGLVILNPDVENPDIENPDVENPDVENPDIENAEVYNPDIENPDIENPDIENPDIENPDIENPDIENPDIENPDIENILIANPDIENPDIENPDIENPDIENPDIENPDIENVAVGGDGVLTDITWKVTNTGNTTSAFNVNLFLASATLPGGLKTQLILHKTYRTPVVKPGTCELAYESRNIILANIPRPAFILQTDGGVPDQNDPSEKNATLWLGPGEIGKITLRIYDANKADNDIIFNEDGEPVSVDPAFNPQTSVTPAVSSQAVGTEAAALGDTEPPLVTPTGANLFFLQMPSNTLTGAAIVPPVAVQVRDNLTGTPVGGAEVTLTLGNNPGNATLAGNVAVADGNGIAIFPALSVSTAGNGYTLVASATTGGVAASAESTPFNVAPLVLVNATLLDAIVGSPYPPSPQALQVTGGQAPFTFAVDPNAKVDENGDGTLEPAILPPGLTLDVNTGIISGTPTTVGNYAFRIIVTDAAGRTAAANFCVHVDLNLAADLVTTALDQGGTATTLAQRLLDPAEAGVSIANARSTGSPLAIGSFTGGGSASLGVGFDRGILLGSGSISGAKGPNASSSQTTHLGKPGDEDLRKLAVSASSPNPVSNDAAILEFDFTPTCPVGTATCNVTFEYVFGSDEYHEFANTSFNDVFGFFLTDTTDTTSGVNKNYALLPNVVPETPVSINTVNGGNPLGTNAKHPEFFRSNRTATDEAGNDEAGPYNLQADGLTTPLQFNAPVESGRTYHIKIGISDIGDFVLDSWVFIKDGSFKVTHVCPIIVQ